MYAFSRFVYMSRPAAYYELLREVRDADRWEDWALYMLTGVEETARQGIQTIGQIRTLFFDMKRRIRADYRFYSQDLLNNLFNHPYTKISFLQKDLGVSRLTATRYLNELTEGGILQKEKVGRYNYYINLPLYRILTEG